MVKRILVIEDDTDVRWMVADYLSQRGYQVDTAIDGQSAINRLSGTPADLVTLDLNMPIVDGGEVAQQLRATNAWTAVPIVLISASHAAPAWAHKLTKATLLQKPFELRDLGAIVERLLSPTESLLPKR